MFDRARAEESTERAYSQKARIMDRYKTRTANDPKEEDEEEIWKGITSSWQRFLLKEVTAGQNKTRPGHAQKG